MGNLILKAIKSILLSKFVDLEIIVMTSMKDASFYNTKTVYTQGGPAAKRNMGLRFANHDIIAFFDDDVEVTPTTIHEMVKILNQNSVGMVFGKLRNMERRDQFDEAGSFLTPTGFLWARAESGIRDTGQYDRLEHVLAGKSASCLIHRKVLSEAGLFDPVYDILGEETDLAWRVWLYGYSVYYVPSSVSYHAFNTRWKPTNFYSPKRVYFNGCRNYISMLITNLEIINIPVIVTVQVLTWFAAGMGMFLTGKFQAGYNIMKGLVWVTTHLRDILRKREKVQSQRKISDRDLFKFIMRKPPINYFTNRFFHYIKHGRHG